MASEHRIRFAALVLSLALIGGACGGGDDGSKKASSQRDDTTTTSDASSTTDGGSTTTGAAGTGTTVKGSTATTAKGGSTATTAKSIAAPGTTAAPAPDPNAVPAPAKTGTYGYSQSGSSDGQPVPSHGTLVVSGGTVQSFKRYYEEGKSPSTLTYNFRSDGPFITSASVAAKGIVVTCNFASPVPLPPWPPDPGKSFSGSATCSNGISATISGSITSRSGDIVGISSTVHATGSGVDVTLHDTESWSISLRVPKSSHQTTSGTALGSPVTGDVSSTLTSTP